MIQEQSRLYPNLKSAIDAGEDEKKLVQIKFIANGPFKGRAYELRDGQLGKRRKDLEKL